MWRTFYLEYSEVSEFDKFLTQIEESGYYPVFMREAYRFTYIGGFRKLVIEALVTSRQKGA